MANQLMTPAAAGEQLGLNAAALAQMRYLGTGPRYVKLNAKAVRYRQADIDEWIEANVRTQTGRRTA